LIALIDGAKTAEGTDGNFADAHATTPRRKKMAKPSPGGISFAPSSRSQARRFRLQSCPRGGYPKPLSAGGRRSGSHRARSDRPARTP
jgi:hypothetical protein